MSWRDHYDRLNDQAEAAADRGDHDEYHRKGKQIQQQYENGSLAERTQASVDAFKTNVLGRPRG